MENTRDLRDFGFRQLHMAGKLLSYLKTDKDRTVRLGSILTVEYNPDSGFVFLIDERWHIAMLHGEHLEDWLRCPTCSAEGFKTDLERGKECCKAYAKTELCE